MNPKCAKCGVEDVKVYRSYGSFRTPDDDRCNDCIENRDYYVPCIMNDDGDVWGYTSVPLKDCERFYALPEKSDNKPYWDKDQSMWSDSEYFRYK